MALFIPSIISIERNIIKIKTIIYIFYTFSKIKFAQNIKLITSKTQYDLRQILIFLHGEIVLGKWYIIWPFVPTAYIISKNKEINVIF